MYRGSHAAPQKSRNHKRKPLVLLVSLVLLVTLAVGGTLAYLKENTEAVTNTFVPGSTNVDIHEETPDNVKTAINVHATGNVPVYVRVAVVVNKVDDKGMVLESIPGPVDHSDNWQYVEADKFYYYKGIVDPGTAGIDLPFLAEGQEIDFNGRTVDVMAQTIQAAGGFVSEKWHRSYDAGTGSWS